MSRLGAPVAYPPRAQLAVSFAYDLTLWLARVVIEKTSDGGYMCLAPDLDMVLKDSNVISVRRRSSDNNVLGVIAVNLFIFEHVGQAESGGADLDPCVPEVTKHTQPMFSIPVADLDNECLALGHVNSSLGNMKWSGYVDNMRWTNECHPVTFADASEAAHAASALSHTWHTAMTTPSPHPLAAAADDDPMLEAIRISIDAMDGIKKVLLAKGKIGVW